MAYLQVALNSQYSGVVATFWPAFPEAESVAAPGMIFDLKSELVIPRCALRKVVVFQAK